MAVLSPPPITSPLAQKDGTPSPTWARWFGLMQSFFPGLAQSFAYSTQSSGQSIPNGVFTAINFDTKVNDADNAIATGAGWHWTCPKGKGGQYQVSANAGGNAANTIAELLLTILVNGSERTRGARMRMGAGYSYTTVSATLSLNPGDTVQIQMYQVQSPNAALVLEANAAANWVTIARIPGV